MPNAKYRRVTDLYVTGTEVVLRDGTPIWMQVLSPFEVQNAKREAQIARSRMVLALKDEDSGEMKRARGAFLDDGRDAVIERMVDARSQKALYKSMLQMRDDPDWKEHLDILERGTDGTAQPPTEDEERLIDNLNRKYTEELERRHTTEREYLRERLSAMSDEDLWQDYLDLWLQNAGDSAAVVEYQLHQILHGARVCEGLQTADGWDHTPCDSHREQVFDAPEDVRNLPQGLLDLLLDAAQRVDLSEREAKNSDRQASSSGSSRLPSAEEASTASTPAETPAPRPGSSSSPSTTPSPS